MGIQKFIIMNLLINPQTQNMAKHGCNILENQSKTYQM